MINILRVPKLFEKLLQSKDMNLQLAVAEVMILHNKKIPDSLLASVASQDRYRSKLLSMLQKLNREELFPPTYKKQEMIAQSILLMDRNYKEFADIQLISKQVISLKGKKGNVYLFKYKIKRDDDWKMGISGLQPLKPQEVNGKAEFVK